MSREVKIGDDGFVYVDGAPSALLLEAGGACNVFLLVGPDWVQVARFSNFRPVTSARDWIKFVLSLRSPKQILRALERSGPVEYARRLGFQTAATTAAARPQPFRAAYRYTGICKK